ncbi:enoyl-CoA hydratase [Nakamurella sp. YIM 132087]|uniref:Enoyl-CoA hydratase n=1 Tax=Nakamurella alba TaxID=2665158 RepID=A0A7K1FIY7_9ACTN|nr:enoyl-CoA hydratase-related protein [Nakamurella alba]MTD14036.1 enoyl-CoA hydratase [Nakamurella alba]
MSTAGSPPAESPPAGPDVLLDVTDGVAVITLNRPARGNAVTAAMGARYIDVLAEVEADTAVRAVVVTGSGSAFCAGADLTAVQGLADGEGAGAGSRVDAASLVGSYLRPLLIPKPFVAAMNGACAGVGLAVAMACDIRICAEKATITSSFARLGLVAEFGLSWILPRIVGVSAATDVLLSGRRFKGDEARSMGLVNEVRPQEDVLARAVEYARDLAANCSPASMALIKGQIHGDLDSSLEDSYLGAVGMMKESFGRPDLAEGVAAFKERRAPRFAALTADVVERAQSLRAAGSR